MAEELPEPVPGEDELVVDVEACGVGLTVLNCMGGDLGDDPAALPRVPGHELVGRVSSVGPRVSATSVGERVAAYFYLFCGRCRSCLRGEEPLCERLAGFLGVHRDGGYAERAVLPERNAIKLPHDGDPALATTIPDAIATSVHVARRAAIGPGQRVVVIAAGGGVGIHMVQVIGAFGAEVLGLDAVTAKLDYLRDELGVSALDSSDFAAVELPARWGGRADVVVDLLGQPDSLTWSVAHLAPGGRLVTLTTFRGVEFPVSPRELVLSQLSVLGSRYATRHEVREAATLVAAGRVRPVVGRRTTIDEVEELHRDLRAGRLIGRGAVVWK